MIEDVGKYVFQKITDVDWVNYTDHHGDISKTGLSLKFENGAVVRVQDSGQQCCENRYMSCDDDIKSLVGNVLLAIVVKDGPTDDGGDYSEHETRFVEIACDKAFITLTTHNVHNGYYGGFNLNLWEEKAPNES